MAKMPIEWYKKNLANLKISVARAEEEAIAADSRYVRIRAEYLKLEAQISRAEEEGKDGFDQDKYHATK